MNILFVEDCIKKLKLGFEIKKIKCKNIYSLKLNDNINRIVLGIIVLFLRFVLRKDKTYIVTSKDFKRSIKATSKYINVTEQNNLLRNDALYINEYIKKEKIAKRDVKIVLIFDDFDYNIAEKLNYFIEEYKIVDVFTYRKTSKIYDYVNKLNNKNGSVIEILDKLNEGDYNILLVFSNKYKVSQSKRSFCLDYNNSDLDVKSNTYLIYQNNKNIYLSLFERLNLDIKRFNKTKLGKLYIHASGIMLDK